VSLATAAPLRPVFCTNNPLTPGLADPKRF